MTNNQFNWRVQVLESKFKVTLTLISTKTEIVKNLKKTTKKPAIQPFHKKFVTSGVRYIKCFYKGLSRQGDTDFSSSYLEFVS